MAHSSSFAARLIQCTVLTAGTVWLAKQVVRHHRKLELAGRTVLITGGSRGLGLAIALEVARQGARVAICARDSEELAAAERQIRALGGDVKTFTCDLRDAQQIAQLIDNVELTFGTIDVLINNAGTIVVGPAQTMTADDFKETMDVNFWAAVHATLAVAPKMKSRGGGRIVNIGSVGGKMPVPHLAPYCASKFALVGFSGAMRAELAKDGVLITGVHPGLMRTGSPRNATFKGNHQAEYAWFSIGDALPGISMSAARAARRVVDAAVHGEAEVVLGLPAKLGALFYGLAPDLHVEIAALVNRAMPGNRDGDQTAKPGRDSESWITRSPIRGLGHRAERRYNQLKVPGQ